MEVRQPDIFDRILDFTERTCDKIDACAEKLTYNGRTNVICWIAVISICLGILLLLNVLTPLISDDFAYLLIYGESARITSIADVVQSQINHYYMWGGRSVVHFIAQVLLMLPDCVADLLNTLVYMIYIGLIYWHIKGRGENSISLFILINIAVWFLQPVFGDTVLWITGSANYLWGTAFILLFLMPYRLYNGNEAKGVRLILVCAFLFLFGIVAGWTNENTAGAMILIALLFVYYYYTRKWKIPFWAISGLVGAFIGFGLMILAPGNFERAGDASGLSLYLLGYRLFNSTLTFVFYAGGAILSAILIYILYRYSSYNVNKKETIKISLIYSIAAIAAVYAMLLSPTFPRRALFGVVSYLIIGMGLLFYNLDFSLKYLRQIRMSLILVGLIGFMFTFYLAVKEIDVYRHMVNERNTVIEQTMATGGDYCEFERYSGGVYIHGEDPFSEELMSRYYGITIKLKAPQD